MKLKLIGSKILKLEANRNPDFTGKYSLDSNINLKSIEKYESKDSIPNTLRIISNFKIDYGELGKIEIENIFFVLCEDNRIMKKIILDFNEKKYNTDEIIALMNIVMQKSSMQAFSIEEEFNLPVHIKLPSIQLKKD